MKRHEDWWPVRLSAAADADLRAIIEWTAGRWGDIQARHYAETIDLAVNALHDGPGALGVKRRNEIGPGLMTLHVARAGRKGRHLLLFRTSAGGDRAVEVLRILHDAMDMGRHTPESG